HDCDPGERVPTGPRHLSTGVTVITAAVAVSDLRSSGHGSGQVSAARECHSTGGGHGATHPNGRPAIHRLAHGIVLTRSGLTPCRSGRHTDVPQVGSRQCQRSVVPGGDVRPTGLVLGSVAG